MARDVRGHLSHSDTHPVDRVRVESMPASHGHGMQPDTTYLELTLDGVQRRESCGAHGRDGHAFHRTMVTHVPTPAVDVSANSCARRRAPGSPSPMPPAVE